MSIIKVTLPPGEIPAEGKQVSFKAPCPCDQTEAIQIEGVNYTVCDALGKCVTGIGGVWDVGSIVTVTLSLEQQKAYVQNNAGYSPSNKPTLADVIGSNENLLDNWYFADPIDQRCGTIDVIPPGTAYYPLNSTAQVGTTDRYYPALSDPNNWQIEINGTRYWVYKNTSVKGRGYIGSTYGIDRWLVSEGVSLTVNESSITASGTGMYSYANIQQKICPEVVPVAGTKLTFSILTADGVLHYGTVGMPTYGSSYVTAFELPDGTTGRVYPDSSSAKARAVIFLSLSGSVEIVAAKLELGSVQTLAHQDANGNWVLNDPPPDKGVETLKCATSTADSTDTFANMGAGATKIFTTTVSTSWTASGSYFYQDVAVSGILATDTPVVGVNPGSDNAANVNYSLAMSNVFRITTSANSLRLWARAKPTVAFPIQIKVVR